MRTTAILKGPMSVDPALHPRLLCRAILAAALALPAVARAEDPPAGREFLVGGDVSALARIEQSGGVFRLDGEPHDALGIMAERGCNCFRLRLFVDPTYENVVVNDLDYTIRLARRIKAAGARWLLDFHFSDTWADPGKQTKPRAWQDLDLAGLEHEVYLHARRSIAECRRQQVMPDLVQVGNEITPGMLWPEGKLHGEGPPEEQWGNFALLLKAAIRGVVEAAGAERPRIVIHVHCGGDREKTAWFFENLRQQGVPCDVIGLSYYPWWHGTLADLEDNLRHTAATFGKDVFVVETAYPYREPRFSGAKGRHPEHLRWPKTPSGQAAFVRELVETVRRTPGGRGLGVLWWFPESIPTEGLRIWHGGATALFDADGSPLPALDELGRAALQRAPPPATGKP